MTTPIRVLVADDHPIVRQGLALIFATQPDIEMVGEAANGIETVQLAQHHIPDVIVLDLIMPEMDGLSALRQVQQLQPTPHVLVLTSFADDEHIAAVLQAGAKGIHLKDSEPKSLLDAIRSIHRGDSAIHPKILEQMVSSFQKPPKQSHLATLTSREIDVLRLLGNGLSNRDIADQLQVSIRTVTTHVRNIMDKLELNNRTQVALYAQERQMA